MSDSFIGMDLAGKTFSSWTVIRFAGRKQKIKLWECRCTCGTIRAVYQHILINGRSTNCGCVRTQKLKQLITKHGKFNTPEYVSWQGMKRRCYNENSKSYPDYGGRGITVCDRWRNSFEAFFEDMGPKPENKRIWSIGRIDNSRGYEPGNCRWETQSQQMRNTRRNQKLTHEGLEMTITDWAAKLGVPETSLRHRVLKGWGDSKAITTPFRKGKRRLRETRRFVPPT